MVSELSNSFVTRNDIDEVHIILYGVNPIIFYNLDAKIKIHKPDFIFDTSKRFISTLKTIFFLRKKVKELQADSVLSFGEYWNNLVLLATYGVKTSIYIADRSTPLKNLGSIQNLLRNWLYPKASRLILQTQTAKSIYKEKFKNLRIDVIGNPIRTIVNKENLKRENIILMVGRLVDTKHHDRLITIFSKINKLDWKLILVGGDAQKQKNKVKLEKHINTLKISKNVILAGNQKDVESYYLKSKIFAFTSSSEGFPNVIGEAMSAGLPVISYDCIAGPSEIITDNEDGFLIPLFDDQLFQNKLSFLMTNEQQRVQMGIQAKKNIKRFNSHKIATQFLKVMTN